MDANLVETFCTAAAQWMVILRPNAKKQGAKSASTGCEAAHEMSDMNASDLWKNFRLGEELQIAGTFIYNGLRRFHEL